MIKKYDDDDIARLARIIVDEIDDRLKLTFESLTFIKEQVSYILEMRNDISQLKADMKTVKAAIRATNKDFRYLMPVAHTH